MLFCLPSVTPPPPFLYLELVLGHESLYHVQMCLNNYNHIHVHIADWKIADNLHQSD